MSRRYLLVDDNSEFAENVAEILTDAGAEVTLAASGEAALESMRQIRFDAVVTDMKMPELSGAQLLQQLREIDAGVPVILLSAWANDGQLEEARRYGLLALLSKHASITLLMTLLEHARRDATVVVVGDALSLIESLRLRGFTVCDEHLAVTPIAVLTDDDTWSERFPGVPRLELDRSSIARLEALVANR